MDFECILYEKDAGVANYHIEPPQDFQCDE